MSLTKYMFLAQSAHGFENTLIKELASYGIKGKFLKERGLHEIQFRATQEEMWRIVYTCRTIDRLKLQLGQDFVARGEKEFMGGLKKLPWTAFLPINHFHNYKMPVAKAKSSQSTLYHTGLIKEVFEKFLNTLPRKLEKKKLKKTLVENDDDDEDFELEESEIAKLKDPNDHYENNEKSSDKNLKDLPTFFAHIVNNDAYVSMEVVQDSMHKHGTKEAVGWGSIRESIISSCLIESGFIEKSKKEKSLRLWDPFCGSGTILMEAFSMFNELPIRMNMENQFLFKMWPVCSRKAFEKFRAEMHEKLNLKLPNDHKIELYGSDINTKEFGKSLTNLESLNLSKFKFSDNRTLPLSLNNPIIRTQKFGEVGCLINADFQVASTFINDHKGLNIFTNLPYGERSAKYLDEKELMELYRRFSKFLGKKYKELDDVYVICPQNSDKILKGFISISELSWERVFDFENRGLKVALFKLSKTVEKDL